MFHLISAVYQLLKPKDPPMKPVGLLLYMWASLDGYITYQSATFYIDDEGLNRKVIINGTPPKPFINEDHIFYHRVIVPFMNKLSTDDAIKFETRESSLLTLKSLASGEKMRVLVDTGVDSSPAEVSTDGNVITVDFGKHDPQGT